MIDFIKFTLTDKTNFENIINNFNEGNTSYTLQRHHFDNRLPDAKYYPIKGVLNGMSYKITPTQAIMCNSIHKYYNYTHFGVENCNFDDFTFNKLVSALNHLKQDYAKYDFNNTKITILEFGVNIETDQPPYHIIENNIKFYKRKEHNVLKNKPDFSMKKFELQNYTMKYYDKGLQKNLKQNLMRIEAIYSTKELEKFDISTINDLYDITKHHLLIKDFKDKFKQTLIVDDYYQLDKKDTDYLYKHLNIDYWKNQPKTPKNITETLQ